MSSLSRLLLATALAVMVLALCLPAAAQNQQLAIARIFIEYNSSGNDLGFHVFLDGEDWKELQIFNPEKELIFAVQGTGPYAELGLTELFFEGAEPSLDEVPLEELLESFPEGNYRFSGSTVDDRRIGKQAKLSHAVPAAPIVSSEVIGNQITIRWETVSTHPPGFPSRPINIVGYQVIVGSFSVTLPASATEVTLPTQFAESLGAGTHDFEVLAIEASGNQTITEGTFEAQ